MNFRFVPMALALLAAWPNHGQPSESIYAKAGAASAMFDLCGKPEMGEQLRAAMLALADECSLPNPLREAHGQAVERALTTARQAAQTAEAQACRERLHYDRSIPAMQERLTEFEAGKMPASQALRLTCERLDQPPGRAP